MPARKNATYTKQTVSEYAQKIRKTFDDDFLVDETDIDFESKLAKMVEDLGGEIEYLKHADQINAEGGSLTIDEDGSFTIFLSPYTAPIRDNFTIAHEIGHYLLHVDKDSKEHEEVTFNRYGSERREWEANWFAAGFLMPEDKFKEKAREFNNDITLLSSYFNTSKDAVKIRLKTLGIIKDHA